MRRTLQALAAVVLALGLQAAQADAVDTLRAFTRDVKTGSASFTQTVTSPDGARKKTSSGSFEFSRPNRFRFAYSKPFEQLIVSDGSKVWLHDIDLNQVSVRLLDQALGGTPAALLAGGSLEKDFELAAQVACRAGEIQRKTSAAKVILKRVRDVRRRGFGEEARKHDAREQ